jgi:TPR repeat protein
MADPLEAARAAKAQWNLNEALHHYRCAAAAGDLEARIEAEKLLDWASSMAETHYLTAEAARGSGEACFHLGVFASGESDFNEALLWMDRGAALGNEDARTSAVELRDKKR